MTDASADDVLKGRYHELPASGSHPDDDTWLRFSNGTLDEAARQALVDHVVTCVACADIARALGALQERASETGLLPAEIAGRGTGRSWALPAWLALAAAVGLAVGLTLFPREGPPAVRPSGTSTPPVATAVPPPTPRLEVRAWASASFEAPPVELPARYALLMRGDETGQAFVKDFGAAIAPYREGRYADAVTALAAVVRAHPDVPEASFYLGVARLLAGDAPGALDPLARARQSEVLGSAAGWFAAIALERSGDGAAADRLLAETCAASGPFKARACASAGPAAPPR